MNKKQITDNFTRKESATLRHRAEESMVDPPVPLETLSPEETQRLIHELRVHQIELTMQNEELRRARQELEASRDKFVDLYDFAPVGYLTLNKMGIILEANLTICSMLGVERKEVLKRPLSHFIVGEEADAFYLHHKRLTETDEPQIYDLKMAGSNGVPFYSQIKETVQKDSAGERVYRATASDITARKQAEAIMEKKENRATVFLEAIPDIVFQLDGRGVFLDYKAEQSDLYAQDRVIIGKRNRDLLPPELADLMDKKIKDTLDSGQPQTFEYQLPIPERGLIDYEARMTKTSEDEVVAIVRDITEKHRAEQDRLRLTNLESLGMLAGGIAHDFNNLLMGIYGNTQLIGMTLHDHHEAHKYVQRATQTIKRATELTNQLLTFARGGAPVKEPLAIGKLLRETAQFSLRGSNVSLKTDIEADLWLVEADKGQLGQVISNLVINAQQAMPLGGTVTITAENRNLPDGLYVQTKIQDEGIGIAPQHLDKIFDPYFSTKEGGHGLGLASTYSIIKRHNGRITVDSALNQGATFTIYLPATEKTEAIDVGETVVEVENAPVSSGRILLLDDERVIREPAAALLTASGYTVSCAVDGQEAITKYQVAYENQTAYDVVIVDLTLPGGIGGQVVAQKILEINPQAKIIISSGYSHDPVMANPTAYGFKGSLTKPYLFPVLKKVLQQLLNEEEPT